MTTLAPTRTPQSLRLIVIRLKQLTLACRIDSVFKVVKHTQVHSSGLGYTGVTHLDGQTVTVIDLHYRLFQVPSPEAPGYFVILKLQTGDLLAVPVVSSPNLLDVPIDRVKALPVAYRQADTLSIASHVAIVSGNNGPITIFVLDENMLV